MVMYFLAKSFRTTTTQLTNPTRLTKFLTITTLNTEQYYSDFLRNAHFTSNLPCGKAVHAQIIKTSTNSYSIFLHNFLLNMYLKFRDFGSARQVLDEMPRKNVVSWSSIITGFVKNGFPERGLLYFYRMLRDGVTPNEFTFVAALNACSLGCVGYDVYGVYGLVVRLGFEWSVYVRNAYLTALMKNGYFTDAVKTFYECIDKDIVSWNAMMSGYLQYSPSEIPGCWLKMVREGMKPDGFTFSTVFSGLAEIRDGNFGMQVHGQLAKYGYGSETYVGNSLLDMYLKFGDLVSGLKVFNEVNPKAVLTWATMATGCLSCGAPNKALEVLREMKIMGVKPNKYTIAATFKACANVPSLHEGIKAHSVRIKLGNEVDTCVDNALLDMYVKCGCMDDALMVFQRMKDRTIVTWTTIVMGYAKNGLAREALEAFDEMVNEGVEPNYITFVCVLYACSQAGFIELGWKYFNNMSKFGISPGEDHYVCMVDLLGRAGHLKEAEELISKMPFSTGALVWQSLLGSCHIHGDTEVGKRAAASLMHLNQSCASAYVTLSNIFAGSSNWECKEALRDMMETRNLSKNPGASLVTMTSMD